MQFLLLLNKLGELQSVCNAQKQINGFFLKIHVCVLRAGKCKQEIDYVHTYVASLFSMALLGATIMKRKFEASF